ncbi:MAG: glycosyltransferase family 2 protein [Chloroflexia bacterium]|nr:glycosyltransferase family 2 protein [Chloroflexia bacterium]
MSSNKISISAFFPAYNDGGTIASMVLNVLITLRELTDDYEVIVVNDGSRDYTPMILDELSRRCADEVRIIHHLQNRGYGGALRSGFAAAGKDWVFYTDGDAQYDPRELRVLVEALDDGVDVVNGYKIGRSDPLARKIIGRIYHYTVKLLFGFKLRDVDCDFRLIRRDIFERIQLESEHGTICLEMVKKMQDAGYRFAEVPVHHFHRAYGRSQFFNFGRLWRTARDLSKLWWKLVVRKEHLGGEA